MSASQTSLLSQLSQVHATSVKQFTLVNAVSATVSALEEQRLAASPAVDEVIPDATVTLPASALVPRPRPRRRPPPATPDRTVSKTLNNVAGACAPKGQSYLAPEGLALTNTLSQSSKAGHRAVARLHRGRREGGVHRRRHRPQERQLH